MSLVNTIAPPKLAWNFEGTTTDYVTGLTGTTTGSVSYNPVGKYGQSLIMNGSSYVKYTKTLGYDLGTGGATFAMWFKLLTNNGNIFGASGTGYGDRIYIYTDASGFINWVFVDINVSPKSLNSPSALVVGVWTHLTFTLFNGTMTMYINGLQVATRSDAPMSGVVLDSQFTLAALARGSANNANAEYDDFRIFNRALTAAEVQAVYNQGGMPGLGALASQYIKSATGGNTVQDINGYRIHTFTTVGTSTFTPATSGLVEVLVVAGGGGGGYDRAGGGGAGGVIYNTSFAVSGAVSVTVGGGGNGSASTTGLDGSNSVFSSLTAIGGGGGAGAGGGTNGRPGGSGGGAHGQLNTNVGGTGTAGQGNAGGRAQGSYLTAPNAAGGGGAGSVGSDGLSTTNATGSGNGGTGLAFSISGTTMYYAGGGGGSIAFDNYSGTSDGGKGGIGGGGNAGQTRGSNGSPGTANTGGGGGGGANIPQGSGGNGGSGIVIIRYPLTVTMIGTPLFSQLSKAATSSAVGAFSLRAVNGLSTGGTARAVQVVWSGVASLPPAAMSGFGPQTLSGYTYGGGGSYTVAESSHGGSSFAWRVFDKDITTQWNTNFTYTGPGTNNSNTYIVNTYSTTIAGSPVYGEWIEIRMPAAVYPYSYTLTPPTHGLLLGFPYQWTLVGSNDNGITWISVDTQNGINTWTSLTPKTFVSASRSTAYSYYRLIIQAVNSYSSGTNQSAQLVEWTINGFSPSWTQDFWADRLGNLLTAPVTGQPLAVWLGGATGNVVTWYDQSGAGNHATQATAANQPIIQKATKGPGYSCLFNGATTQLVSTLSGSLDSTNYTICSVSRRRAAGEMYYIGTNGPSSTRQQLSAGYYTDTTTVLNEYAYALVGVTIPGYSAGSEPTGYDYSVFSQTNGTYIYNWRSGTSYASGNSGITLPMTSSGNILLGYAPWNGANKYFSGEIFELTIFKTSLFDLSGSTPGTYSTPPSIIQTIYQNQLSYTGA